MPLSEPDNFPEDIKNKPNTRLAHGVDTGAYEVLRTYPLPGLSVDKNGIITHFVGKEESFELHALGIQPNLMGRSILDIQEIPEKFREALLLVLSEQREMSTTISQDGRHYAVSFSPRTHEDGSPNGANAAIAEIVKSRVITERRSVNTTRLLSKERINRLEQYEVIAHLVAGVLHDLNNFIVIIEGAYELMKDPNSSIDHDEAMDILGTGIQQCKELIRIIPSLLHDQSIDSEILNIKTILSDVIVKLSQSLVYARRGSLKVLSDEAIWDTEINEVAVIRIILNLVKNASEAIAPKGKVNIRVTNELVSPTDEHDGRFVCLEVSDNGRGMPPEVVDKIFDSGFSQKKEGMGLGLGLPSVLTLVEHFGGFIRVESEVGVGTIFRVYFPAVQ